MDAVNDERERVQRLAFVVGHAEPSRMVRPHHHLASPQQVELVECERPRQSQRDATAHAATIEPEHETWGIERAARRERPQTKTPMQSAQCGGSHLGDREHGVPKQGSVREYPPPGALWLLLQ